MDGHFSKPDWPRLSLGYWSAIYVREGDAWKIRMWTINQRHRRPRVLRQSKREEASRRSGSLVTGYFPPFAFVVAAAAESAVTEGDL